MLNCYPPDGGRLGGGTNNKTVSLSVQWRYPSWTTVAWQVQIEGYIDGTYFWNWDVPSSTNHWYGPYTAGPIGIWEPSSAYWNFDGTMSRTYSPWSRDFTFGKYQRVQVRARVGLATYSNATGTWSSLTWHPARTVNAALGYQPGYCAI